MKHVAMGDPRACRLLAHRLAPRVQLLALRLRGDCENLDAVVVRALCDILRSAPSYRPTETIESWADAIAIRTLLRKPGNAIIDWLRLRPAAARALRLAPQPAVSSHPHRLSDYLAALPAPEREVLVLRMMNDHALEQIAELTATPLFAVRSRLIGARTRLRRMICAPAREGAASPARQRWADCMDRLALGEALAHDELAFCEGVRCSDACARIELELLDELLRYDARPNAQSRALIAAVLQRVAFETERADREEVIRLKAPAHGPRLWWTCAAIASIMLVLAVALLPRSATQPRFHAVPVEPAALPQLIYAAGEVRVDGASIRAESLLLAEGNLLEVARGTACLSMESGIVICTGEGTRLRLSRMRGVSRRLDLDAGRIAVQLPLQPHTWPLTIVAGPVSANSTGATFALEADAGSLQATVLDGEIEIATEHGSPSPLGARHDARIQPGRTSVGALGELAEAHARALLRPALIWRKPLAATLDLRGLPANAEILVDDRSIGRAPLLTRLPAGIHTLQVDLGNSVLTTLRFSAEIGKLTALSFDDPSPIDARIRAR